MDKQLESEWIIAQSILGEIITNDFSKENYEKYSVTDLFTGQDGNCRISWETWKRYYTENLKNVLAKLEKSDDYKDFDGNIIPIKIDKKPKKNVFTNRISQAEVFFDGHQFFYDKNKLWWCWNKNDYKWAKSDEVEILGNIYDNEGTDIINSKERTEIINSLKHVGRKKTPKEIIPTWIQFNKEIYDITTGDSFEASPDFYITNPIPYDMGESEDTPTIDKLFISWVGEEHKQELYEVLAFAQAPKYFIHRIICLIGAGANGKSTFLSLLRKYLGDDNVVSSSLEALMKIRFEGSKLYKKLVCLMGETSFGTLTQTDYIKGLSGEDKMRIEFKGKNGFDAVNNAKLIIATNSLPATADKTDGFYRRWKIINFDNKFKVEKDVLADIPKEEYNNLATKCFRILQEMWKNRIFTNDGNFEDRKSNYEKHSNPLVLFIEENFEKDVNADYLSEDFREDFIRFLVEHGFRELSPKIITQQLALNGFEIKQLSKKINGVDVKRKFILGLKKKKVSDVSDVSGNPTRFIRKKRNEIPDTSDTSDTLHDKPNNSKLKNGKN